MSKIDERRIFCSLDQGTHFRHTCRLKKDGHGDGMVMVVLVINTVVNFYKENELFKIIGKRRRWCLLGQNSWWTGQGIALVAKGRLLTGKAGLSMTPSPLQRAYNAVYCHVYQRPLPSAYRCLYNTIYGSINQWPPKLPSLCMSASLLFRSLNDYHLFVLQSAIRIQNNFSAQSLPTSYIY